MARRIGWGEDEGDNVQYWLGYQQARAAGRPIAADGKVARPVSRPVAPVESPEQVRSRLRQQIAALERLAKMMGWTDEDRAKAAALRAELEAI